MMDELFLLSNKVNRYSILHFKIHIYPSLNYTVQDLASKNLISYLIGIYERQIGLLAGDRMQLVTLK